MELGSSPGSDARPSDTADASELDRIASRRRFEEFEARPHSDLAGPPALNGARST